MLDSFFQRAQDLLGEKRNDKTQRQPKQTRETKAAYAVKMVSILLKLIALPWETIFLT